MLREEQSEDRMTEKGYSKVAVSPNKALYEELHAKGYGMVRLRNKALELGEDISTQTFWRYFNNPHEFHPTVEESPKKEKWKPKIVMDSFDTM